MSKFTLDKLKGKLEPNRIYNRIGGSLVDISNLEVWASINLLHIQGEADPRLGSLCPPLDFTRKETGQRYLRFSTLSRAMSLVWVRLADCLAVCVCMNFK